MNPADVVACVIRVRVHWRQFQRRQVTPRSSRQTTSPGRRVLDHRLAAGGGVERLGAVAADQARRSGVRVEVLAADGHRSSGPRPRCRRRSAGRCAGGRPGRGAAARRRWGGSSAAWRRRRGTPRARRRRAAGPGRRDLGLRREQHCLAGAVARPAAQAAGGEQEDGVVRLQGVDLGGHLCAVQPGVAHAGTSSRGTAGTSGRAPPRSAPSPATTTSSSPTTAAGPGTWPSATSPMTRAIARLQAHQGAERAPW